VIILKRHKPSVGQETLGVIQAIDGNIKAEITHLRNKAEDFAKSMQTGFLSKNDTWYALMATILKTMEYPMATPTMNEKEWNYILAPILQVGLPRAGIDHSYPRDVLFGPKSLQGFGIIHP
jgi:hypothetical protein